MGALVDTNVISELVKPRPNPGVLAWSDLVSRPFVSVITVEEVCFGLALRPNARLQVWFDRFFDDRCVILELSVPIARLGGSLRGQLGRRGRTRSQADLLIAATASHHGLTLATRNVDHFADCGITVMNPFS